MTDLTEYANRMVEERHIYMAAERVKFKEGILHLAGELQREDVIETGARSIRRTMIESPERSWNYHARTALTAMLGKIAEVDTHEE